MPNKNQKNFPSNSGQEYKPYNKKLTCIKCKSANSSNKDKSVKKPYQNANKIYKPSKSNFIQNKSLYNQLLKN